jgi:hypothetical protein
MYKLVVSIDSQTCSNLNERKTWLIPDAEALVMGAHDDNWFISNGSSVIFVAYRSNNCFHAIP